MWETKCLSLRLENKARIPALITLIHLVLEFLASATEQETEMKGIGVGQEEIKLFLLADDIVVSIENPKESKNKQAPKNKSTKVTRYKISNKSIVFLYTTINMWPLKLKRWNHLQPLKIL